MVAGLPLGFPPLGRGRFESLMEESRLRPREKTEIARAPTGIDRSGTFGRVLAGLYPYTFAKSPQNPGYVLFTQAGFLIQTFGRRSPISDSDIAIR